jgi:hypothetical protein
VHERYGFIVERTEDHLGTTDWVQETFDFVAPRRGEVSIACHLATMGWGSGTIWFDDLRLERIAPSGGLRALEEPPRGCRALAEWARLRTPPQWDTVADALGELYQRRGQRDRFPVGMYLDGLEAAAEENAKLHARLVLLYGEHAWEMRTDVVAERDARRDLRQALEQAKTAEKAPLASTARLGRARLTALHEEGDPPAVAQTVRAAIGDERRREERLLGILLGDAQAFHRSKNLARADGIYEVAVAVFPADHPLRAEAERARMKFLTNTGKTEAAWKAASKLADSRRDVPQNIRTEAFRARVRLAAASGDAEATAKQLAAADAHLEGNRSARADLRLECAAAQAEAGRWDDAAATCMRLVASFPRQLRTCFEAQRLLVKSFMQQRRFEEALAAAKVLYGAAPNSEKEITEAVNLLMRALKARYRSIALANDFATFQACGPAGRDGQAGTEDDIEDPLKAIEWEPAAEMNALFQKTLAGLPEDFQGRRWRGYLYLYWGKPDRALKEFVQRYDAAPLEQEAIDQAIDDLVVALKAACGHTLAGERFMAYQKHGPKGEDGRLGTEDDLEDPLRELLKPGK